MRAIGILGPTGQPFKTDRVSAIWHPSPNFGARRHELLPHLVVIHYTAMHSAAAALARLCDPGAEVSAHYLIGRDGTTWQLVREYDRAWHAGVGSWAGFDDVNSRSIGIELDNRGDEPFPEPQFAAMETLLAAILERWSIPAECVIGHSDMAPGRKVDPGHRFDWARLARQGLAAQPLLCQNPSDDALLALGYTADVPAEVRREAFLLRNAAWCPRRTR